MNGKWVIAVDYYIWDEENDCDGVQKNYLYTKGKLKIYVFHETLDAEDDLVSFSSMEDAHEYIVRNNLDESICYENVRIERVM